MRYLHIFLVTFKSVPNHPEEHCDLAGHLCNIIVFSQYFHSTSLPKSSPAPVKRTQKVTVLSVQVFRVFSCVSRCIQQWIFNVCFKALDCVEYLKTSYIFIFQNHIFRIASVRLCRHTNICEAFLLSKGNLQLF